jgi:hypothetical protein
MGRGVTALILAAVAALGACGVTSSNFSCQNADCQGTLSGAGSDVELDSLGITIELVGVDGDEATFAVVEEEGGPDEEVTIAEGQSAEVVGAELTVEGVEGDEVSFTAGPG